MPFKNPFDLHSTPLLKGLLLLIATVMVFGPRAGAVGEELAIAAAGRISLPGPSAAATALTAHPLSRAEARQAMGRELRGWTLSWDPEGGGRFSARGKLAVREAPAAFAPRFVAEHAPLLGMDAQDLIPVDVQAGRIEHHLYRQAYRGLPVEGSRLSFAFGEDGSPLTLSARTAPDIVLRSIRPGVVLERAQAVVLRDLPRSRQVQWDEAALVVLPRRFSGLAEDRLAWRLRVHTEQPHSAWRALVDAQSGELLERESLLMTLRPEAVEGHIEGMIHDLSPYGPEIWVDYPNQEVRALDGETLLGTTYTDENGEFLFDGLDTEAISSLILQASLCGPYAKVYEDTLHGRVAELEIADPALPATMTWDSLSAMAPSRAVFIHTNSAHDRIKAIEPAFTDMDRAVDVIAVDSSQSCNAFASLIPDAPRMTFLVEGGPCPNTAEIADVVFHEYGHLVTMYAYLPEWAPSNIHEGFSDYLAGTITDSSIIGRDFQGEGTILRNMDNDLTWPMPECDGESHCEGQVLGGCLWHMREALIDEIGDKDEAVALADSLYPYCRRGRPMTYDEILYNILLWDDDDGDMSNGTPHLYTITDAFQRHTVGDYDVNITPAPVYDTEDTTSPHEVQATLGSIFPLVRENVKLHYSTDGVTYVTETMTGTGYDFSFDVPAQSEGTVVRYYITAEDETGRQASYPAGAPEETLTYFVGIDSTAPVIAHDVPTAPTTSQDRIWLWAEVTDNIGLIDFVRADVTITSPDSSWTAEVALAVKGSGFYEGTIEVDDLPAGTDIAYHFVTQDGSSQANEARYPETGDFELDVCAGRLWDFEDDIADLTMTGDWEWGVPAGDPGPAPSGTGMVGTVLDGLYNDERASELTTPEFDLSDWEQAMLEFHSWYITEDGWDGGRVLASRDHGATWELLTPAGGYPSWIRETEYGSYQQLPAFAGEDGDTWATVHVPLDLFVGDTIQVQFRYWADESSVRPGWYLDDVKILETQAMAPPEGLTASAGEDGRVTLSWQAPVGINVTSANFVGYHLYRDTEPDGVPEDPITTEPLESTAYSDTEVANGTRYYYTVVAVYTTGESDRSETAGGYPYLAELSVDSALEFDVEGTTTLNDTLLVANAGTGDLYVSTYIADEGDEWTDLVPQVELDGVNDEEFVLLAEDPAGAPTPDLAGLSCRELNGNLSLRLTLHDLLPDPMTAFTAMIYLDTDMSPLTGAAQGNIGGDYLIALGALVYAQAGVPAFILRMESNDVAYPIGAPSSLIMQQGLDSLEVSAWLPMLGSPERIGFSIQMIPHIYAPAAPEAASKAHPVGPWDQLVAALAQVSRDSPMMGDLLPDPPETDWLSVTAMAPMATPEEPLKVAVDLDFSAHEAGDYAAKVFLATNDPDHPVQEIPLAAHLWFRPLEGLTYFTTTSRDDGLLLEWAPVDPDSFTCFLLSRWGSEEEEDQAISLGCGPITAADDSLYQFLDRSVESGLRYHYRLSGLEADGDTVDIAPAALPIYDPPGVARLVMEPARPNPFRSNAVFRVHVPAGNSWEMFVVDTSGRLVRQLMRKSESEAGIQMIQWDGRDENGDHAAQGVYYAVARSAGKRATKSIVLVR